MVFTQTVYTLSLSHYQISSFGAPLRVPFYSAIYS